MRHYLRLVVMPTEGFGRNYGWGSGQPIPAWGGPVPNPAPWFASGGFAPMRKGGDGSLQFSDNAFWTEMFGPQKTQSPYPLNYSTEHGTYPDFLRGAAPLFSAVFITSLTATDLVPLERMLPLTPWTGQTLEIEWDEWIFHDHLMDVAPEEVPFRTTESSKRSYRVGFRRYNRGLRWELTGEHTEMGKLEVKMGMKQLKNAFLETACMDVLNALLTVRSKPGVYNQMRASPQRYSWNEWETILRRNIDMWAILQKGEKKGALLIDSMKDALRRRGVSTENLLLYMCAGAARYINQMQQQVPFAISGKTAPGPAFPGAPALYESRYFRQEAGSEPWDPMFQRATIGSVVPMNDEHVIDVPVDEYRTFMRNVVINSATKSADVVITLDAVLRACGLFDVPDGERVSTAVAVGGRARNTAVTFVPHWRFADNEVATAFQQKYKNHHDLFNTSAAVMEKFISALVNSRELYDSFFRLFGREPPGAPPSGGGAPPSSGGGAPPGGDDDGDAPPDKPVDDARVQLIYNVGKRMEVLEGTVVDSLGELPWGEHTWADFIEGKHGSSFGTRLATDSPNLVKDHICPMFNEDDQSQLHLFGLDYLNRGGRGDHTPSSLISTYRRRDATSSVGARIATGGLFATNTIYNALGVTVSLKSAIDNDTLNNLSKSWLDLEGVGELAGSIKAADDFLAELKAKIGTHPDLYLMLISAEFTVQQLKRYQKNNDKRAVRELVSLIKADLQRHGVSLGRAVAQQVMNAYQGGWTEAFVRDCLSRAPGTAGRGSAKRRQDSDELPKLVAKFVNLPAADPFVEKDWWHAHRQHVRNILLTQYERGAQGFGFDAVCWMLALDTLRSSINYHGLAQELLDASNDPAVFKSAAQLAAAEWDVPSSANVGTLLQAVRSNITPLASRMRETLRRTSTGTGPRIHFPSGRSAMNVDDAEAALHNLLVEEPLQDSRALHWCLANDVVFPLAFNLWRMSRFLMGSCLMMVPDGGTGYTFVANADARRSVDGITKTASLNCTIYAKSIVMKEDCVVRQENVFCKEYHGGYGHGLYDLPDDIEAIQNGVELSGKDIVVTVADINWRPATFWLDSTGRPDQRLVDLSRTPYERQDMYPYAKQYASMFSFSHGERAARGAGDFYAAGPTVLNTLYFLDHYKGFRHTGKGHGTFDAVHTNKGPWGEDIYPGVDRVWRGGDVMLKPTNYNNQNVFSLSR